MRWMDWTPLPPCADFGDTTLLEGDGGGGDRLKKRHSSSCVASDGTLPAHITHSERLTGGWGWYGLRAG